MKKQWITFVVLGFLLQQMSAQTTMKISSGTYLVAKGQPQMVLQNTSLTNDGQFSADSSYVRFSGTGTDSIVGSTQTSFFGLGLDKSSSELLLGQAIQVDDSVYFLAGNLELNGNDITLGTDGGGLSGESESSRVIGASGGEIVKVLILNAPSGVNPGNMGATITSALNMGATIVRRGHVPQNIPGNGSIERYYEIIPATNSGLNASINMEYFDAELNGLKELALESWHEESPNWINYAPDATDDNANFVEVTANSLGKITLGEGALKLSPKVFLQGAYAVGTGLMNDALRSGNVIPTSEPYTALGFTHVGGGGETISSDVLNVTGNDAIMDWLFLELRSKTDSSIVQQTKSVLLQRDGDVVDLDGRSPVSFAGLDQDEYYLMLKHRNHLGVRSSGTMTIARIETSHDFSSSLSQAWTKNGVVNASMVDVSGNGTVYALFTGDVTGDQFINATDFQGTSNLISPNQFNVYQVGDLNLDGNLNATDFQTSNNVASPNKVGHVHD
ncbi:MAG: dockerin type I domain-containing protein [Bacteroidota bacterium]